MARLLEQRNFLAQHGTELGHTWSVASLKCHRSSIKLIQTT